ncbi:hypothetical protein [Corallococcus silvisoli]|uniref:hypothetical protein n=1 Tax=Corallococcus silvisoli TaxID=2697031 RepID=UPI0013771270|nr:hypothetical protein [Corallococcus silvisoli]NBD08198.1 hypothetical protein [Corallococcus silvisoli]
MRTPPSRPVGDERPAGVWACVAVLHLAAVSAFIWTDLSRGNSDTAFDRGVRTYKGLSGVVSDYRFFAPAVSSDTRTGFFLELRDGSTLFQSLESGELEVGLRYQCIVASSLRSSQKVQDVLAQSWAAVMLGVHPEASRVTVVTQSYVLPPMRAWAAGKRPDWTLNYTGTFDRRDGPAPESTP